MPASHGVFFGIDLGTGGVRALAVTAAGEVVARAEAPLDLPPRQRTGSEHEQPAEAWWVAFCAATRALMAELDHRFRPLALCADGTSGTVVFLDTSGAPLRPAIMYNDGRATAEAKELNERTDAFCRELGYRFAASFAMPKVLWVQRHEPEVFERTRYILHQSDYLEGRLVGRFDLSDYSNALKTGYDIVDGRWPDWTRVLPGVAERLPEVVAPGERVGGVTPAAAAETGLPAGLPVIAGATDGTAGFLASGTRRAGDANTTLGTTLVFKLLSRRLVTHPDGLIYSHLLPGGLFLPGAASNTGCDWITSLFSNQDLAALDRAAASLLPIDAAAYPLVAVSERFPFASTAARGFCVPELSGDRLYAACLQGTAMVERMGYEVLDAAAGEFTKAGASVRAATQRVAGLPDGEKTGDALRRGSDPASGGDVYSTGGGSRSDVWMQCRADCTGRVLHRPAAAESAFGVAVLAALGAGAFPDLPAAIAAMVRVERTFAPDPRRRAACDDLYGRFRTELRRRGYA